MLGDNNVCPVVAVSDMAKADEFYSGTLGLEKSMEGPAGTFYKSGSSGIFVYPNPGVAGTDQGTHLSWDVQDVDGLYETLKAKGVTFEQYELPGMTRNGDIHEMGDGMKAVWFKDPDGNILSFGNMSGK